MVAGAAYSGAPAARPERPEKRLSGRAPSRAADAGQLAGRQILHRRLDRLALPARSQDGRRRIRAYPRRHGQSACAFARRLLAGTRRRSHGPPRRRQRVLRAGGQAHRHLLRPACARPARAEGTRADRPAHADVGRTRHARQARSRARGRIALQPQRTQHAGLDLRRDRRKRHRCRRHVDAGRGRHQEQRSPRQVFLGRFAHARGLPMDYYAYPTFGLPDYKPIAPPIERGGRLFDRPPGKRLQPAGSLLGERHGPDAGDARGGHATPRGASR